MAENGGGPGGLLKRASRGGQGDGTGTGATDKVNEGGNQHKPEQGPTPAQQEGNATAHPEIKQPPGDNKTASAYSGESCTLNR